MKYLLLIVVLAVVFYGLGQRRRRPAPPPAPAAPPQPQAMSSCAHCGLHLPSAEALPGRGGMFCSAEHRAAYEATHRSS